MDRSHFKIEWIISRDKRICNIPNDGYHFYLFFSIKFLVEKNGEEHLPGRYPPRMPVGNQYGPDICERICFYLCDHKNVRRFDRRRNFCLCRSYRGNSSQAASVIYANFSYDFSVPPTMLCLRCVDHINSSPNHASMHPHRTVSSPCHNFRKVCCKFSWRFHGRHLQRASNLLHLLENKTNISIILSTQMLNYFCFLFFCFLIYFDRR